VGGKVTSVEMDQMYDEFGNYVGPELDDDSDGPEGSGPDEVRYPLARVTSRSNGTPHCAILCALRLIMIFFSSRATIACLQRAQDCFFSASVIASPPAP
jgi:hypothetical protein